MQFFKLNRRRFYIVLATVIAATIFSFLNAWAKEEGTLGKSFLLNLFADSYSVLRFPTHSLILDDIPGENHLLGDVVVSILFYPGLLCNALIYSLLIEFIITKLASLFR